MVKINTNRKSNIKLFLASGLFAAIILFAACNNNLQRPVDSDNAPDTGSVEMATIKIDVSNGDARSVLPSPNKTDLKNIKFYGTWKSGGGSPSEQQVGEQEGYSTWQTFVSNYNATFSVQTGLWDFRLVATIGDVEFQGIVEDKTVETNSYNDTTFTLAPTTVTTGGILITITTSGSAATIEATLKNSSNETKDSQTLTITEQQTAEYSVPISTNGLEPGDYNLTLDFKSEDTTIGTLNTWKGMVRVSKGLITTGIIDWATDTVYSIIYHDVDGVSFVDGIRPQSFTRKSAAITLPQVKKAGYAFEGWYTEGTLLAEKKITTIAAGTTYPVDLYPKFIDELYVKQDGTGDGLEEETPLGSIDDAITKITSLAPENNNSDVPWKIRIIGEVQGAQIISDSLTTNHAESVQLIGTNGSTLNRNLSSSAANGSALTINTSVPVTISMLIITGGKTTGNGGGILITSGSVTLGNDAIITGNEANSGGGVYVSQGATLTMSGSTALIGDTSLTGATTTTNCSNIASDGGAIYGSASSTIHLYDGIIAYNYAAMGGAVYSLGTLIVKNTICNNYASDSGGGLALQKPAGNTNTRFELNSGAYLHDNEAQSNGGAIYIPNASLMLIIQGKVYVPYLTVNKNDVYLYYNQSENKYAMIHINGALTKHDLCGDDEPYLSITPFNYEFDAPVVVGSTGYLLSSYAEKIGVPSPATEWPIFSVRGSNGRIYEGYEITPETYSRILTSTKLTDENIVGKKVKIIYSGTLDADILSNISAYITESDAAHFKPNVYLDLSEANISGFDSIADNLFTDHSRLVSIVLPDGIKTIGKNAFFDSNYLDSVILPDGLETIDDGAFYCCNLDSIEIPESVTTIGSAAFEENQNLSHAYFMDPTNKTWEITNSQNETSRYESLAERSATVLAEYLRGDNPDYSAYRGTWTKVIE